MQEIIKSSKDNLFILLKQSKVRKDNSKYECLKIQSNGLADKHVVSIQLNYADISEFTETMSKYKYEGVYVSHGIRNQIDSFEDTKEYIKVLQYALEFAKEIDEFVKQW